jgi:hypothetical protein
VDIPLTCSIAASQMLWFKLLSMIGFTHKTTDNSMVFPKTQWQLVTCARFKLQDNHASLQVLGFRNPENPPNFGG